MKDELKRLVQGAGSPGEARNRAREYLQARILRSLQRAGAMIPLAFQGGTACRKCQAPLRQEVPGTSAAGLFTARPRT